MTAAPHRSIAVAHRYIRMLFNSRSLHKREQAVEVAQDYGEFAMATDMLRQLKKEQYQYREDQKEIYGYHRSY